MHSYTGASFMKSFKYIASFLFCSQCFAQSTPSELAEMSFDELFFIDSSPAASTSPWTMGYAYKFAEYKGYLDGDSSLSNDEVLWEPGNEPRTSDNFPVVPTVITQEVHTVSLAYEISPQWQVSLLVPYIRQETDHISIVGNYETFVIETDGLGDITTKATYRWNTGSAETWAIGFGLRLPTGSIDEEGDTPRAPGDQELPYTMQLGSGTYDFPLDVMYKLSGKHQITLGASANIRTGTNDRGYRLGNNYKLTSQYSTAISQRVDVFGGLSLVYSDSIHGQDDALLIDSPFPYPASITNPDLYGGKKVNLNIGLLWEATNDFYLKLDINKPVYQYLNGPQPKENWTGAFSLTKKL
jgi:hypothetical protein